LTLIDQLRQKLNSLKNEEIELRKGLGIFKIDHAFSKDIQNIEKDVEAIQEVWLLVKDWESHYDEWKVKIFNTLETQGMDEYAQQQYKKLLKYSKDLRVN
jgi:dynein heavy chain